MKYVPNIQKGKVKIHPKDDKFKIVSSKKVVLKQNNLFQQFSSVLDSRRL